MQAVRPPAANASALPPSLLPLATIAAQEDAPSLLSESIAALIAMDCERLQGLAARAARAEPLRCWRRMDRRQQAAFLAERQLYAALLAETRRNLRLLQSLSPERETALSSRQANGLAYEAVGTLWAD